MYIILKPLLRSWRNRILQAEIQGDVPETHPHWWDGVPLTTPPPPLIFAVSAKGPMLDNYFTGNRFDLYSERLITLLREAGVQFETFPATLVDRKTKEPLPVVYAVFHLLEIHPGLNVHHATQGPPIVDRAELNAEKYKHHMRPFFRAQESPDLVLVHETLKLHFDTVGITGCNYIPVEEFGGPLPSIASSPTK